MSYPTSSGLKFLLVCWVLVFLAWFILSIVIQSKNGDDTQVTSQDSLTTYFNIQLLAIDIVLVAITMAACLGADWHRSCAARSSAKWASGACFLVWFIAAMPLVAPALRRDSESCDGDFYCQSLKTAASLSCICVILHFFTWIWALTFDNDVSKHHPATNTPGATHTTAGGRTGYNDGRTGYNDHHVCDATTHSTMHGHPLIYGLFILSLLGLLIWAVGVFIIAAGDGAGGFSAMPVTFFALFFALLCALVPLAHRSYMLASIAFWWTVLTTIFGWALIILALRQAREASCSNWDCRANITSIAGATVLLFTLTLLAFALFFFHMFQMRNDDHVVYSAPMSSHTGVTHTEVQHAPVGYVDRTTVQRDTGDAAIVQRSEVTTQRYG